MKSISILLSLFLSVFTISVFAQTGTLQGHVLDSQGNPLPFTTVVVYLEGETKHGTQTGEKGVFQIHPIEPGNYTVEARYLGSKIRIENTSVDKGQTHWVCLQFKKDVVTNLDVCYFGDPNPVFTKDPTTKVIYTAQQAFPWR